MTAKNYEYYPGNGSPIYSWTKGVPIEDQALKQLYNISHLPFIHDHVAAMPDVHWGMGATIGSVIATNGAIVPAAVGVDIGCGMMAVRTDLKAEHLPDNLHQVRLDIESAVPHGRTNEGGKGDRGSWGEIHDSIIDIWEYAERDSRVGIQNSLHGRYKHIVEKHPKAKAFNTVNHIGTLGTGNHFIEICLDESGFVWVMLHSGSRGPGNKIGQYFINAAKEEMRRYYIDKFLPDLDLAYLVEHRELFDDYCEAVHWAQDFALVNRKVIMEATLKAMKKTLPEFKCTAEAVNCHHNYISRENHLGSNVIVTRKGAVRARVGDLGIIPGSMGTGSFIIRGLGNPDSFHSCSHGAGRSMSRGEAKKSISLEQHALAMKGIEARLDSDVLDESPAAYKDIGAVMKAQSDLVEVVHRLHQVVNVKG